MMSRTLLRGLPRSTITPLRTYATTHAPSASPVQAHPLQQSETYDAELDPQLHDMAYPKLYTTSRQLRSPRGWWDTQERINFGEPVPESDDIQSMWAPDVHKVKPSSALFQLLSAFAGVGLFATGVYFIKAPPHALPRGYPQDGSEEAIGARPLSANEIED
ncbi:hypothetical protein BCR35DRAFT_303720 [Leucosporidium creatinivorum]|uniref:NADH:ubiquinone oxidoreductase 20.1kD subunit n=1 Tax=Leucosporidium creatinivorum TaxID=106004 RepID=A0A1Y2FEI5_9BASI|nr:hypothetical protein BCR35DRAFT_303720 [Leucosporidium creatinivorum]